MTLTLEEKRERNRIAAKKRYHALTPEQRRARNSSEAARRAKAKYRADPENRAKENAATSQWYQRNKAHKNARSRSSRYGLTPEQLQALIDRQNNVCAICKQPPARKARLSSPDGFAIDHCHRTARVRGLLCEACNKMLGHAKDDILVLQSAIEYLKEAYRADV